MTQFELHKKIELFIKAGINSAQVNGARALLLNDDAKRFFFSSADKEWVGWLWQNNFLDEIKKPSIENKKIFYRLPELDYLTRMATEAPSVVTQILLDPDTATTKDRFNPEVIDRFLWIATTLPAENIKQITTKIRDEKWLYTMRSFEKNGYEFKKIVDKLVEANANDAILELAQSLLLVKDAKGSPEQILIDKPFYLESITASGIFTALANIDVKYQERALKITTETLSAIVKLTERDRSGVFEYSDMFALFDVDLFTLEIEENPTHAYKEDVRNLVAVIKVLVEKTIAKACDQPEREEARQFFTYINAIPLCRSTWRLKLFAMSQCPDEFISELRSAFFKLFSVENYFEIEGGTEYKKTLTIAFPYLPESDKRLFVKQCTDLFSKKIKYNPDKPWFKRVGWEILSSICNDLTQSEKKACEKVFGSKCDATYVPEPDVKKSRSGFVQHRSPADLGDFTVSEIIQKLQNEWSAEKIEEQYKDDDFLNPRGVEGLGDALKVDVKKRTEEYLSNINHLIDAKKINLHYSYSILRGIEEVLREERILGAEQLDNLIIGLRAITNTDKTEVKNPKNTWLADWIWVYNAMGDILMDLLRNRNSRLEIQSKYRTDVKNLISFLFKAKESHAEQKESLDASDLHTAAINSVRGRAFEALVLLVESDGRLLADDVKEIYLSFLSDNSLAMRFIIGRYLASFYFRDKEFITSQLQNIFPKNIPDKERLFVASWEGYLSNVLYDELFTALYEYYSYAITINTEDYSQTKSTQSYDEALAVHLALAFIYLKLDIDDPLFIKFWSTKNVERHSEFISFIGRECLTRDVVNDEWLEKNKINKEKLILFWDWALDNDVEQEALAGFGFWINPNKEVLNELKVIQNLVKTLQKSNGNLDWNYGLLKRLPTYSEVDPEGAFEIIHYYLLDSENNLTTNGRMSITEDHEIKVALSKIYKAGDEILKQNISGMIDILILKGSSKFWYLKGILN
ncbi:MAG: hypothetical protein PHS79_02160 [Patescibacteria group bacterium]|nr:hypothetical protein [Patescibacteria group bacterium]